jgi:serine/threonine protein kinase/Tfp pilus assembly protein PilF
MSTAQEKSLFLSALDLPTAEERQNYLQQACDGQPDLRAAVERLLAAHDQENNCLDAIPPTVRAFRERANLTTGGNSPLDTGRTGKADQVPAETVGSVIGPYHLREKIGEGGFGHVFVAEQQQPVRRTVALKVIKPGMDSREVIARFEAERQALALMNHPNIARVLDAGTTDSGKPYFVMELVHGEAITDYCRRKAFSMREQLELFIDVCHAVQHAHQKGIIHRDLKPANVLVTSADELSVVKVIDFGVAKALSEPLTNKTLFTRFAQVIGTPLYMSPEQLEMTSLDVDTRSDIYSLGVLLYEILTGTTPFDQTRLQSASFDELRQIIREEEPPRPSVKLTMLDQAELTTDTKSEVPRHTPPIAVRGDLDWIVMKALEKDRTRRYETATEFAADVRRYLNQEPIAARPPSPWYRFSKFARRNKVLLSATTVALSALVLGTVVSAWQAWRATVAQGEADRLRQEAVDSVEHLKQANVLLDNARANADGQRWAVAYQQYTTAAELQPAHYPVWSGRAALLVRLGLWERAATDFSKALDLDATANNPGWWGVPQLFLYAGDQGAYEKVLSRLHAELEGANDSFSKMVLLRGNLATSNSMMNSDQLVAWAEALLVDSQFNRPGPPGGFGGGGPGPIRPMAPNRGPGSGGNRPQPPRRASGPPRPRGFDGGGPPGAGIPRELALYVAGLAHLRAGNTDLAVKHLLETNRNGWQWPNSAMATPALALAYSQQGQTQEAKAALQQARSTLDQWLNYWQEGSLDALPVPWLDFLEYLLIYHEAYRDVMGDDPPEDSQLVALEERALAAIR